MQDLYKVYTHFDYSQIMNWSSSYTYEFQISQFSFLP